MPAPFDFTSWFQIHPGVAGNPASVYVEVPGTRDALVRATADALVEHYVGIEAILRDGGYDEAADVIGNSLPTRKRIRSGDLGEVFAVEFLHATTKYRSPIYKLRYKTDRNMPLFGDDVIAIDATATRPRLLKGECKSRTSLTAAHVTTAAQQLDAADGRPKPDMLSFITKRLYEQNRDAEAAVFSRLQSAQALHPRDVEHLVFVLAGNNPTTALSSLPAPQNTAIGRRWAAGVMVSQHSQFIDVVFAMAYGR